MKVFLLIVLFFISICVQCQIWNPSFADDIIISDHPERDQRVVAFCSGYDSSLFCSYGYYYANDNYYYLGKSSDNGLTWTVLIDGFIHRPHFKYISRKIVSFGTSVKDFRLVRADLRYDSTRNYQSVDVTSFLPSGESLNLLFNEIRIHSIDIASDDLYPQNNSPAGSFAYVYSVENFSNKDSLILRTCTDGGFFNDRRFSIHGSDKYIGKVGVAYARSKSHNQGRYFVVWEEKDTVDAMGGKIYLSHQISDINSYFTEPICLNNYFDPEVLLTNPRIACQYNDQDNISSDLSVVVLTQKPVNASQDVILGFYSLSGVTDTTFNFFVLGDQDHNCIQPDIVFNPFDSTFNVTFFDSTERKIPYLTNDFNLQKPQNWTVVSNGINEDDQVSFPQPDINMCFGNGKVGVVWSSDGTDENGVGLFDAQEHYYTAVNHNPDEPKVTCFPNPSLGKFKFQFSEPVTGDIKIYDMLGQNISIVNCNENSFKVVDLSNQPSGIYFFTIMNNSGIYDGTLILKK